MTVAQMVCKDEDGTTEIRFIDRHNGWGLSALHIAVFQGSVHTGERIRHAWITSESPCGPAIPDFPLTLLLQCDLCCDTAPTWTRASCLR